MPSGDCLWLVRPNLGVHQERSCLHLSPPQCMIVAPIIPPPSKHRSGRGLIHRRCTVVTAWSHLPLSPAL